MEDAMKETTMMIKSKVVESSSGPMAENTMESGSMANSMEKESIILLREK